MSDAKNIAAGLLILDEFAGLKFHVCCEHDIICAGPDNMDDIDAEAAKKLEELGWFWSEEYDRWAYFT